MPLSPNDDFTPEPLKATRSASRRTVMWGWERLAGLINWLDKHDGSITALATLTIAILTAFYVNYSRAQWSVMRDQLAAFRTTEGAILTTGKFQGDIAEGSLRLPIENHGRIPSKKTWITVRVVYGLPVMIGTGDQKFGGENTSVPPGIGEASQLVVPVSLKLQPGLLEKIRGGEAPTFIAGVIDYENGLDTLVRYPFCLMYLAAVTGDPARRSETWGVCEDSMAPLLHAFDPPRPVGIQK